MKTQQTLDGEEQERKEKEVLEQMKALEEAKLE
jgi:hypothetical protein